MINLDDTIAAISTPIGVGGIAIIRLSGDMSFRIIKKMFKSNTKAFKNMESHTISYGKIVSNNGNVIDEAMVTIMHAPRTYTMQNIVEINCHGGIRTVSLVLAEVLSNGARLAEPGEFTKRAFINGRIDLSQAEAVIDIINAQTNLSHKAAQNQLKGGLSEKIKDFRGRLIKLLSHIEASIDYPEHDLTLMNMNEIKKECTLLKNEIKILYDTSDMGRIIRAGIDTAITGKPNVGKSSFLNAILGEDRAIVTDISGTTRDVLVEYVNIRDIPLKIVDTAGIHETENIIEKMGVEKSIEYAEKAELILFIIDQSIPLSVEDFEIIKYIKNKNIITVLNKCDLESKIDIDKLKEHLDNQYFVKISCKNKYGFNNLYDMIAKMFFSGVIDDNINLLVVNERQKESLFNSLKSIEDVLEAILKGFTEDIIAIGLTDAYRYLGEIIGEAIDEDIINRIFSEFCIGK